MFVLWAGNMRGPRIQTTVFKLVLLLLLLLSGLRRTVLCQDEDAEATEEITEEVQDPEETVVDPAEEGDVTPEGEATDPPGLETTPLPTVTDVPDPEFGSIGEELGSGSAFNLGDEPGSATDGVFGTGTTVSPDEGLDLLLIVIPVALVILLIAIIVCGIFIYRRSASKNRHSEVRKEDPYLEGCSTEKVPMPMFEEDVPSVLELEMDELDDWMKKDDLNQQA